MTHESASDLLRLIHDRTACRGFIPNRSVPRALTEAVLRAAAHAPSSQNGQPWSVCVLTGKARDALSDKLMAAHKAKLPAKPDYLNRPSAADMPKEVASRIADYGRTFLPAQGIKGQDDAVGRDRSRGRNFEFFDAPCELIVTIPARSVAGTFLDVGLFIQSVLLGYAAFGVSTCPQYSVASYAPVVRDFLNMGADRIVICGIAVGYRDASVPLNAYSPARAPLSDFAVFIGDDEGDVDALAAGAKRGCQPLTWPAAPTPAASAAASASSSLRARL